MRLNQCSLRLWQTNHLKQGLAQMLRSVVELLGAEKGNVQILDPERNILTIAAQQGFEHDFLVPLTSYSTRWSAHNSQRTVRLNCW